MIVDFDSSHNYGGNCRRGFIYFGNRRRDFHCSPVNPFSQRLDTERRWPHHS